MMTDNNKKMQEIFRKRKNAKYTFNKKIITPEMTNCYKLAFCTFTSRYAITHRATAGHLDR